MDAPACVRLSLATRIAAALLLGHSTGRAAEPPTSPRVFADLEYAGRLRGPLSIVPRPAFAIAVPLPSNCAGVDVLPGPGRGGEDVALRLGRLRVEVEGGVDVALAIKGENSAGLHLYRKAGDRWRRLAPDKDRPWTLRADGPATLELGVGVELPEAKAGAGEPGWPGAFAIEVGTAAEGSTPVRVPFRVAPFLIPSPLDPVDEVLIVSQASTTEAVKALEASTARMGLKLFVHQARMPCDQWMQDTIEPGVFTFPAGPKVGQVQAALTGLREEFGSWSSGLDRQITEVLRGDGAVAVVPGVPRKDTRWIDWYGNLEVSPAHTGRDGRRFAYGRLITGEQGGLGMHPGVMKFLEAQAMQWPPIVVDTSWLMIGHVDEVVNFVPAKTKAGFKVLSPSPKAARDVLDALLARGLGDLPVFEGTRDVTTVRKLREGIAASGENLAIDGTIAGIREQLRKELDLGEADFVRLPVLFDRGVAIIPNAVNSLILNGQVLAPEPRGPRLDGKDRFEEAIREALAGSEVRVAFVNGWRAYHVAAGEIHCGTNTFRRLREPAWWDHVGSSAPAGKD